jgi:teichuronic acid biosynthesis glycosyltransferase TuaC
MKVLHVTNMYPYAEKPWYGIFIHDQIKSLDNYVKNDVYFINGIQSKWNYFKAIKDLRNKISEYDIIHCHHGWTGIILNLVKRNSEKHVCVSLVGGDLLEEKVLYKKLLAKILWRILPNFDFVIVKSSQMLKLCSDRTQNIECIPNGVNMDLFKPINKEKCKNELKLDVNKKYFLFTAAANDKNRKEKRYDIIDEAKKLLINQGYDNFDILFLSNVSHKDVPLYINACEAVLMSSDYEGSPNIIKEALACNVPVISTDVGNVKEMIEGLRNCYIISQDSQEFAKTMQIFLDNKNDNVFPDGRNRLISLGLDQNSVAKKIYKIYQRVYNGED